MFQSKAIYTLLSNIRPRSAPALELLSRATSSVGVCTVPAVPTQEAIPEEGGYKKMLNSPMETTINNVKHEQQTNLRYTGEVAT